MHKSTVRFGNNKCENIRNHSWNKLVNYSNFVHRIILKNLVEWYTFCKKTFHWAKHSSSDGSTQKLGVEESSHWMYYHICPIVLLVPFWCFVWLVKLWTCWSFYLPLRQNAHLNSLFHTTFSLFRAYKTRK